MHKSVLNCSLTPSQGKYSFDPVSKVLAWEVGKMDQTKLYCAVLSIFLVYLL